MKLSELVQELRCNILRDTSSRVTSVDDPGNIAGETGWSDAALVRYINDAERTFARRTFCLVDSVGPLTEVELIAGQSLYSLPRQVIRVLGVTVQGCALVEHSGLPEAGRGGVSDRPMYYGQDEQTQHLTLYPAPAERYEGSARLRVARYPRVELTLQELDREPEIPYEYHLDLLEWAAWRALRNHDVEVENFGKANGHKAAFNDAVLECQRNQKMKNPTYFAISGRM